MGFCNILNWVRVYNEDVESYYSDSDNAVIKLNKERLKSYDLIGINEFLENVNAVIYYILATPIETGLTESQMQTYENLHTNRPVTTVSATEGAGLELTYKTKKSLEVTD